MAPWDRLPTPPIRIPRPPGLPRPPGIPRPPALPRYTVERDIPVPMRDG